MSAAGCPDVEPSVTLWRVTEEPQMGPEERLFRSRQSWTVYAFLVLTTVGIVVGVILALTH